MKIKNRFPIYDLMQSFHPYGVGARNSLLVSTIISPLRGWGYKLLLFTLHLTLYTAIHAGVIHTTDADFSTGTFTGLGTEIKNNQIQLGAAGCEAMHWVSSTSCNLTSMLDARSSHAMAVWNGRLYVTGGYYGSNQNTVWMAPINADGTVGNWIDLTPQTPLLGARSGHAMSVWNGRLYITGGSDGMAQNTVWMAPINADGTIGNWIDLTPQTPLLGARSEHAMAVWNGRLYITGGYIGGIGWYNTVWMAPINADGTIGNWIDLTPQTPLLGARSGHDMAVWNGRLYVSGGWDGSSNYSTVWMSSITANGTIGNWTTLTSMPAVRYGHAMSIWNERLYVSGGSDSNTVWMASITANGTIGSWTTLNTMPAARDSHGMAVWNGRLYVTGGYSYVTGGSVYSTVWMAPLNSEGTVNSWTDLTPTAPLPDETSGHGMSIWNGRLYVSGGRDGTDNVKNTVLMANINADGIGAWDTTLTAMPDVRKDHAMSAWNGRLYITGGSNNVPPYACSTVWMSSITANGTIGIWIPLNSMPNILSDHAMGVWNGRLYVTGGCDGDVVRSTVSMAPLNADGTIGSWTVLPPMPSARQNHAMSVWNGRLYVTGGENIVSPYCYDTVWMSSIQADGTIGSWNTTLTFMPDKRTYHAMSVWNGRLCVTGGYGEVSGQNIVWMSSITADGTIGSWNTFTPMLGGRQNHVTGVWNGRLYVTGGAFYNTVWCSAPLLYSSTGTYFSPLIDMGALGDVKVNWDQATPAETNITVSVANASLPTSPVANYISATNGQAFPSVRYINYRLDMLADSSRQNSPTLSEIRFNTISMPSTITNLTATTESQIKLTWTAPNNGYGQPCGSYLIKCSTTADIKTDEQFIAAATYCQTWVPQSPSTTESKIITGLIPRTTYWFSIKSSSATISPTWSVISATGTNFATSGSFVDSGQTIGAGNTTAIAWGDYDNDGDLDIVVGDWDGNEVWRNNGDGTFTDTGQYAGVGLNTTAIAWGDYDNDGDLDIVVGNNYGGGNPIYRNNGNGTFTDTGQYAGAGNTKAIAWGDYDNDGDLDIVVGNYGGGNPIYRNNGNGTFTNTGQTVGTGDANAIAWGDYDNDGDLDIVVGNYYSGGNRIYMNNGDGTFTDTGQYAGAGGANAIAWGDYDNDGDLDIVVGNGSAGSEVWRNNGDGTFTYSQDAGAGNTKAIAWGDYDNDGDLDIVMGRWGGGNLVYRNNGNGTFTDTGQYVGTGNTFAIAWGDYDNDGDLDLLVGNYYGEDNLIYKSLEAEYGNINSTPTAPTTGFTTNYSTSTNKLGLRWDKSSDTYDTGIGSTPPNGLYYDVRVSTFHLPPNPCPLYIVSPSTGAGMTPFLGNYPHGFAVAVSTQPGLNLTPEDTTYYYQVRSIDTGLRKSIWSVEKSTYIAVPPAAVTDLTAESIGVENQAILRWSAPGDNGWFKALDVGSSFKVQRSTNSDGNPPGLWNWTNAQITVSTSGVTPKAAVSYVATGLIAGASNYIRIWHADEVPNNWSGISNGTTVFVPAPICNWISPAGFAEQTSGYTLNQRPKLWFLISDGGDTVSDAQVVISANSSFDVGVTTYQYTDGGGSQLSWDIANLPTVYCTPKVDWLRTIHYLRVRAYNNTRSFWGNWSATKKMEIKNWIWTDPDIFTGLMPIRKLHIDELRTVIGNVRNFRGFGTSSWTDPTITQGSTPIRKPHIDEMRQFLDDALYVVGESTGEARWTDDYNIVPGVTPIRKTHFQQLRDACVKP
ncbi:MAG: FG-GAP-like repeat-containing protein [Elusimicrobiota bacterium]